MRLLSIAVLALAVMFGGGCDSRDRSTDTAPTNDSSAGPETQVSGARIYLYDGGRITTSIRANTIHSYEEADSSMGYQLSIDLYDAGGEPSTHVTADSGIIRESSNLLHLFGHVVVDTRDSTRLETDYLKWNPQLNRIQTDAFVKITKHGDVVTGWGLEADRELTRIKILRQVSGSLKE